MPNITNRDNLGRGGQDNVSSDQGKNKPTKVETPVVTPIEPIKEQPEYDPNAPEGENK